MYWKYKQSYFAVKEKSTNLPFLRPIKELKHYEIHKTSLAPEVSKLTDCQMKH